MAAHYGVTVRAFNVSVAQIASRVKRAARAGLSHQVEFVEDDYAMRPAPDAFVSVGMLEHVGLSEYQTFGSVIDRSIGANGRGLLHFIGRDRPSPLNPWIRKRIFPGAYPPTLTEVFERSLMPQGLSVLDVENLRLHYEKTLSHWLHRFNDAADTVAHMFDETFVRAWRLYLSGSQVAFRTGSMQLFQVVFARGGTNRIPWTRVSGL
jgi:cyclopropane-fatty-acyl-phospholipid synthase